MDEILLSSVADNRILVLAVDNDFAMGQQHLVYSVQLGYFKLNFSVNNNISLLYVIDRQLSDDKY